MVDGLILLPASEIYINFGFRRVKTAKTWVSKRLFVIILKGKFRFISVTANTQLIGFQLFMCCLVVCG
jgi:hypothetical protein